VTRVLDAEEFTRHWLAAWNAHDIEAVLAHFHEDIVFTSPVAAQLLPHTRGVLRGKAALRMYWAEGLNRIPDLRFTVEAVYVGVDTVVINYRNQRGNLVNEVLVFDGGLVREGHGTYLSHDDPAGATAED
jgi:ketosteroid isomerase-like protein